MLAPDALHGDAVAGDAAPRAGEGLLHPAPEGGRLPLEPQQLSQQQVAFFLQKGDGLTGQEMLGLDF